MSYIMINVNSIRQFVKSYFEDVVGCPMVEDENSPKRLTPRGERGLHEIRFRGMPEPAPAQPDAPASVTCSLQVKTVSQDSCEVLRGLAYTVVAFQCRATVGDSEPKHLFGLVKTHPGFDIQFDDMLHVRGDLPVFEPW